MAGDHLGRHRRLQNRTLILTAITLILSTIFFSYMHLNPTALALSRRPSPNKPDELNTNNAIAPTTMKDDKDRTERTYPQISTLPASLLPTTPETPQDTPRRLIIIGDVHGHLKALEALLQKAEFSVSRGDTVIFAGDMVNKGPDSAGVVAFAMRIGAYAVRGNHEDRVLRAWEYFESKQSKRERKREAISNSNIDDDEEEAEAEETDNILDANENGTVTSPEEMGEESQETQGSSIEGESEDEKSHKQQKKKEKKEKKKGKKGKKGKHKGKKDKEKKPLAGDLATAKSLKPEHRAWLSTLPLILRIGDLGPRYGEVLTVHAGLVPGIPLERQDPEAVMNMRTLLPPSRAHSAGRHQEPPFADHIQHQSRSEPDHTNHHADQGEDKRNRDSKAMIPSPSRDGTPWAKIWTSYQTSAILSHPPTRPTTVVYGHDAKSGLQLRRYTFGLDSGCGRDDALTGVIFEYTPAANSNSDSEYHQIDGDGEGEEAWEADATDERRESRGRQRRPKIRHRLVSVSCA
ncbi:Metallo-dependent phosphatase [Ustulina deusta]|nr:Metallo-dependent phosphatase [Ustulina deusta]